MNGDRVLPDQASHGRLQSSPFASASPWSISDAIDRGQPERLAGSGLDQESVIDRL